jgi:hypothetical protein
VTFRYKDRAADRQRKQTVAGHEFIRRFLQHVEAEITPGCDRGRGCRSPNR